LCRVYTREINPKTLFHLILQLVYLLVLYHIPKCWNSSCICSLMAMTTEQKKMRNSCLCCMWFLSLSLYLTGLPIGVVSYSYECWNSSCICSLMAMTMEQKKMRNPCLLHQWITSMRNPWWLYELLSLSGYLIFKFKMLGHTTWI